MSNSVVEVRGLSKAYGDIQAVDDVDLTLYEGEVFALLGPNGAGKTTTVEILEGFRDRDTGEVSVLGHDPADGSLELKAQVGIVLQSTGVDPYLTVRETIDMFADPYPSRRPTDEVIEVVGLDHKADARVNKLSGGQQRRLDVAVALAGDPRLLFLDEPTTGFDPAARRDAWEVVDNLRSLGKTILLTTHYMDEAQALADRLAIIASGRIVAEGTPETLGGRAQAAARILVRLPADAPPLPATLHAEAVAGVDGEQALELRAYDPVSTLYRLTGWILDHDLRAAGLEVSRPTLEEVYLRLTGSHEARAGQLHAVRERGEDPGGPRSGGGA